MHNPTSKFHTFLQSLHFKMSSLTGKRFGDSRGYENQNRTASCLFSFRIPGNHANIDWIRPAGIHGVVQGMGRPAGIKGVFKETVRLTEINGRTRRWSDPAGIKETGTTRCLGANMMNGPLDKIPGQ